LTEPQRDRHVALLLHAGVNHAQQEARCHGGHFTSQRHASAVADAAGTEGRHR
jgi:hypothetical protein